MDVIDESDNTQELRVRFYPELFLQRRIWILNILRKEGIRQVLDVGCGEGQILGVLCQPSPWLTPPPASVLPPIESPTSPNEVEPSTPTYNDDDVPNLHMSEVHGLDIDPNDLVFAIESITPPQPEIDKIESPGYRSYLRGVQRWEELVAKVWKGGLEVINEEFVDIECIVSTEVIEHLTETIFPAFAPMLLGVYHPKLFLVTTPSYTFNARFTHPDAPKSARNGYPDPTGRTDRIFRHSDHKFEWTKDEFATWCDETAREWGYDVERTSIGRALDPDPWGRDEELEGASFVALFRRREDIDSRTREERGRATIKALALNSPPHEALAIYQHSAEPLAMKPKPLSEIANCVKIKMEEFREAFMRLEELWFEREITEACGGWIEFLVRAVEDSPDLNLRRDIDGVVRKAKSLWRVELVGGVANQIQDGRTVGENSVDYIPPEWTPIEGPYDSWEGSDAEESNGGDGDISANVSDDDGDYESDSGWRPGSRWNKVLEEEEVIEKPNPEWAKSGNWAVSGLGGEWGDMPASAMSSSAGWDGDESGDTTS